jgi:hypothetical protein
MTVIASGSLVLVSGVAIGLDVAAVAGTAAVGEAVEDTLATGALTPAVQATPTTAVHATTARPRDHRFR